MKKSWRDVTINDYYDLRARLEDEALNEYDREIIKIAFAAEMPEEDVWNLSIPEFRKLQVERLWMDSFNVADRNKFGIIELNGHRYKVDTDMQSFTVAQYIDFQTFYPKRKTDEKVLGNILACFLIPEKKKYGEGYDIRETVQDINEYLDIMTANEILFFFLRQYLISIRATANFFNWQMRRMKRTLPKEKYKELEEKWEETKKAILLGLRS